MKPVKLIVSNKKNLLFKYGDISGINQLLKLLQKADNKKGLDTKIVFIDDAHSTRNAGVKKIRDSSEEECKRVIDDLYKRHIPAYIVILGSQDVIPFQQLTNQAADQDTFVFSDLPYACDAPFSRRIDSFSGPTRVVGRIPDVVGKQTNIKYLERVITNSINHIPLNPGKYRDYFALSAWDWQISTRNSLHNMFGDNKKLQTSPPGIPGKKVRPFTQAELKPLTHFINCHGGLNELSFYGQKGNRYVEALHCTNLNKNISHGTIVISECCFGSQLFEPSMLEPPNCSIANNYLGNNAIAFLGSSTISYGPVDSQSLSDLITQFFVLNILKGASTGRALLEARQRFLAESGPDLDPYEQKTIAQFYLLGDPSVQPADCEDAEVKLFTVGNAIANSRKNLFIKGMSLKNTISTSEKQQKDIPVKDKKSLKKIFKKTNIHSKDKISVHKINSRQVIGSGIGRRMDGKSTMFHTYVKDIEYTHPLQKIKMQRQHVLVVKENDDQILGWRVYESK